MKDYFFVIPSAHVNEVSALKLAFLGFGISFFIIVPNHFSGEMSYVLKLFFFVQSILADR